MSLVEPKCVRCRGKGDPSQFGASAANHPWFQQRLNCPKIRTVSSTVCDDRVFFGSSRFFNDIDSENPHQRQKRVVQLELNHQHENDMFHALRKSGNTKIRKLSMLGMVVGERLEDTISDMVRHVHNPKHPQELMNWFERCLLVSDAGVVLVWCTERWTVRVCGGGLSAKEFAEKCRRLDNQEFLIKDHEKNVRVVDFRETHTAHVQMWANVQGRVRDLDEVQFCDIRKALLGKRGRANEVIEAGKSWVLRMENGGERCLLMRVKEIVGVRQRGESGDWVEVGLFGNTWRLQRVPEMFEIREFHALTHRRSDSLMLMSMVSFVAWVEHRHRFVASDRESWQWDTHWVTQVPKGGERFTLGGANVIRTIATFDFSLSF